MSRWKVWLALAAIFLSGIAIGALGTRQVIKHYITQVASGEKGAIEQVVMKRFRLELGLSDQQAAALRPILADTVRGIHQVRLSMRPQVEAILERSAVRMKQHLSPSQAQDLDGLLAQFKAYGPVPLQD